MTYNEMRTRILNDYGKDLGGLPETLDGELCYWPYLPFTVYNLITKIDNEFNELGTKNIKASETAVRSKELLRIIMHDLQDKSAWNRKPQNEFKG